MKRFASVCLVFLCMALIGCGSNNSNASNINGTWNATLASGGNTTVFAFGTSLRGNGDGSLTVSNFQFTTNSPCFVSGETESGSFMLNGNFNGNVNGKFGMSVLSGNPSGNTLALAGSANGNTITAPTPIARPVTQWPPLRMSSNRAI